MAWTDTLYSPPDPALPLAGYEVAFANNFTTLAKLGAKFDPDAYLYVIGGCVPGGNNNFFSFI